jgi:hypothetical protein
LIAAMMSSTLKLSEADFEYERSKWLLVQAEV